MCLGPLISYGRRQSDPVLLLDSPHRRAFRCLRDDVLVLLRAVRSKSKSTRHQIRSACNIRERSRIRSLANARSDGPPTNLGANRSGEVDRPDRRTIIGRLRDRIIRDEVRDVGGIETERYGRPNRPMRDEVRQMRSVGS